VTCREPDLAPTRPIPMERRLGTSTTTPTPRLTPRLTARRVTRLVTCVLTCLVVGLTAGCHSSSSTATDPGKAPASDPAGVPSRAPGPVADAKVLPLISLTGAGGRVASTASLLNTPADVRAFAHQFGMPAMWHRIQREVADVQAQGQSPGHDVVGQIVMVGCDRPPGVTVSVDGSGDVVLTPKEVARPLEECLAAVTTVAIAVVPRG
jgi:hypothetical protein